MKCPSRPVSQLQRLDSGGCLCLGGYSYCLRRVCTGCVDAVYVVCFVSYEEVLVSYADVVLFFRAFLSAISMVFLWMFEGRRSEKFGAWKLRSSLLKSGEKARIGAAASWVLFVVRILGRARRDDVCSRGSVEVCRQRERHKMGSWYSRNDASRLVKKQPLSLHFTHSTHVVCGSFCD
jgi:hypothetical protein